MMLVGVDGLFHVCNPVGVLCFTEDVSTGCTRASGCSFSADFGAVVVACTGILSFFF